MQPAPEEGGALTACASDTQHIWLVKYSVPLGGAFANIHDVPVLWVSVSLRQRSNQWN